jgi:hypothetical protein
MLVLGPVIGCDVSDSVGANACESCGHANPAGLTARWCGVCGAQLADPDRARTRVGGTQNEPPAGWSSSDGSQGARANGRWSEASGPFRLAVTVVVFAVLVGVVVVTTGRDWLAEPPADPDDDVELPAADALDSTAIEQPETVREIAPGAVVWSDRVTTEPLSPGRDLEVAGGLIITAEPSPAEKEDEIAADVVAVDAMTGEHVWKRTVTAPTSPATLPRVAVAGRWVIVTLCAQLTGLDLADGEVAWQHRTDPDHVSQLSDVAAAPRDDPEVILVVASTRISPRRDWAVTAVDVVTGEVRWKRDVVGWAAATPDAAVVLDEDGRVSGLAAATGEPIWEITSDDPPSELHSVAGAILEAGDQESNRGWLRAPEDGRLLFDDEVHRHGLVVRGRNLVDHRIEVVTTAAEVALIEDGAVSWAVAQPHAACCVSSHVPPAGAVAVLLADGTLLRLDRDSGAALSDRDVGDLQETNTTLAGRFVLAADEPFPDRAGPLRLIDTADPPGWRPVATLTEGQVVGVLPEGDVILLANDQLHRLTNP